MTKLFEMLFEYLDKSYTHPFSVTFQFPGDILSIILDSIHSRYIQYIYRSLSIHKYTDQI